MRPTSSLPSARKKPLFCAVGDHVVDVGPRHLVRLEDFKLARLRHRGAAACRCRRPAATTLAVDALVLGADLVNLDVIAVQLRRQAPRLKRLRLAIELRDAALELHRQPRILLGVEAHAEDAGRRRRLQHRHLILGDRAGLRIELAEDLLAERWRTTPCRANRRSRRAAAASAAAGRIRCRSPASRGPSAAARVWNA